MKLRTLTSLVAVGALAMLGFSSPAFADGGEGDPPPVTLPGPNISPNTTGKLTVHKYVSPGANPELPNNGTEITPAPDLEYLNGVTFTVTPITGVDLTTNAGWEQAALYAAAPGSIPAANLDADAALEVTTSGTGVAVFSGLSLGAYLVTETGLGTNNIIAPASPFVVTIPLPTTVDDVATWITDVHVYPKNMVSEVQKTVNDSAAFSLGDEVTWTISAVIPGSHGSEAITSFSLLDSLDSRLIYSELVEASFVPSADADPADPIRPLVEDTDFEVNVVDPSSGPGGQQLEFALLDSVLGELPDFVGGVFTVTFKTVVIGVGDGTIVNTPLANVNDNSFSGTPVTTVWGVVQLFKFEQDTSPKVGLAGAVFQVFTSETGGEPLEFLTLTDDGEGGFTETWTTDFVTDADGKVTIPGLRVGVDYWVEEVVAPPRFQQLTERVQITGLSASNGVETPLVVEIPNIPIPDWLLPLTGGSGVLIPLLGFALLAVSAGSASMLSRKKSSASAR